MVDKQNNTVKRNRRWGLRRFLLLAAGCLVLILATPYVLERWLDSNLDYERIRTQTAAAVRQRTGLEFTSQGLRFHLVRGIVFNGVRFIEPKSGADVRPGSGNTRSNGVVLARTENLALRFSVLDYLRGLPPVHTIQMNSGRVLPGDRGALDFWRFFQRILQASSPTKAAAADTDASTATAVTADAGGQSPDSPPGADPTDPGRLDRYLAPRLRFVARDIQIQSAGSLAYVSGADRIRIDFQASMPDPELVDDTADFELSVRVPVFDLDSGPGDDAQAADGASGPLRCRGSFRPDGSGRLYFTFTDTPLPFIARMLEGTALAPLRLTTREAGASTSVPGLRIQTGTLTGDGSFDVYPGSRSGAIGVNFEGRYRRLGARLYFAGGRLLEFRESAGKLEYNGGFELGGDNRHFRARVTTNDAGGGLAASLNAQSGYNLEIVHRDIEADPRDRANAAAGSGASTVDEDRFALRGFLNLNQNAGLGGFASGGRFQFDLDLDRNARKLPRRSRAPRVYELRGFVEGQDLSFRFARDAATNENGPGDLIEMEKLRFDWGPLPERNQAGVVVSRDRSEPEFAFEARGRFAEGDATLSAQGRLDLQPTADASLPLRLVSDLEIEGRLDQAQVARVLDFLRYRYANVRRLGYDPESRRAEDAGPLWQNKFFESDFYRSVVEGLRARARFEIRGARPTGTLPPELNLVGRTENGYLRVESENGFNGGQPDAPEFQLKYESNLQAILPRQDLQLRFRVPRNRLAFESFTADPTPPANFDLRYFMGGEGLLPGDLMQRTYSRLELEASGVSLGRNRLLDIMRHEAGLSGDTLRLERLDLTRSTDGGESSLRIRAGATDVLNVEGSGENLAGIGGSLRLRFRFPDSPGDDRRLKFRIRPDGGYVPEL